MPKMLGVWAEEDPFFSKKRRRLDEVNQEGDYMAESRKVKDHVIKINMPSVQQRNNYSCGAAVVQAICKYYGVGPDWYEEYIDRLGTDPEDGTQPDRMIEFMREHGLQARLEQNMDLQKLKTFIDQGKPVIVMLQAYGSKKAYKKDESGHYVVAIGYDRKHIYFEDPSSAGVRTFLPNEEFEDRWHDRGEEGENKQGYYYHAGIVVTKKGVRKPSVQTKLMD